MQEKAKETTLHEKYRRLSLRIFEKILLSKESAAVAKEEEPQLSLDHMSEEI
jgi:hypothetical protein